MEGWQIFHGIHDPDTESAAGAVGNVLSIPEVLESNLKVIPAGTEVGKELRVLRVRHVSDRDVFIDSSHPYVAGWSAESVQVRTRVKVRVRV